MEDLRTQVLPCEATPIEATDYGEYYEIREKGEKNGQIHGFLGNIGAPDVGDFWTGQGKVLAGPGARNRQSQRAGKVEPEGQKRRVLLAACKVTIRELED